MDALEGSEVQTREGDHDTRIGWDRKIPITYLLTALGIVAVQAIAMWANQRDMAKDVSALAKGQDKIAADMSAMRTDTQVISTEAVKQSVKIENIERRVDKIEARDNARSK